MQLINPVSTSTEGILVSRLMEKADGIWVFGFEKGERRRLMETKVRKMYGEKAQYFSHPEIGKELLLKFAEQCAEVAAMDKEPKLDGRHMSIFLSAKTAKETKK